MFYAAYEAMDLYLTTTLDAEEVSKQHVERIASFLEVASSSPLWPGHVCMPNELGKGWYAAEVHDVMTP